jgi:hypothetical protein
MLLELILTGFYHAKEISRTVNNGDLYVDQRVPVETPAKEF